MSALLSFDEYVETIVRQAGSLADDADAAGPDRPVPSCPDWTVRDLVSHLGVVHRWATTHVQGHGSADPSELTKRVESEMPADFDAQTRWLRRGAEQLVEALQACPTDLEALVFLRNAPSPRLFWARRQAHETTIHRIDALSARIGHLPTAAQLELDSDLAVDGLDELLTGFLPRASSRLRSPEAFSMAVAPTDSDHSWTVHVSADPPVTRAGADSAAGTVLTGTAVGLYITLWNRADEIGETGHEDVLGLWRELVRIHWR